MNKIIIDKDSWSALNQWVIEHAGATKASWNRAYFTDMEIHFTGRETIAYATKKKDRWSINVKFFGKSCLKVDIEEPPEGYDHDFEIGFRLASPEKWPKKIREKVTKEVFDSLAQFVAAGVIYINAYLMYGNAYEDRPVILSGKNDGNKKVIVFRLFEGKAYAVSTTAHKSPSGVFGVRGHFRRYKDGKVIWIDEYLKGLGKEEK